MSFPGKPASTWQGRQGQPTLLRCRPLYRPHRRPVAGPARALRQLRTRLLQRYDRWARKGVWQRVINALQDPDLEWLILDSTIIRAHPCAAGARKKSDGTGGQDEQALGRSRGGFGTKIHGAIGSLGLPARLILTAGQAADVTQAHGADQGVAGGGRHRG